MVSPPLAALFSPTAYRFRVGVRPGDGSAFFAPTAGHDAILAERRRWLGEDPRHYAQVTEAGRPLLEAFHHQVSTWAHAGEPAADCSALGAVLEPDFLLLAVDPAGDFRLQGGALCFPTSWALEEKLGATVEWIHGVVPGLNTALGPAITRVLSGLAERGPLERLNWGLAATAERNLHPALARPRLQADCVPESVWLRVEHQLLAPLAVPGSSGVLFALRIELVPLTTVLADPGTRHGFARALATMPDDVAAYKGLAAARSRLLAAARDCSPHC